MLEERPGEYQLIYLDIEFSLTFTIRQANQVYQRPFLKLKGVEQASISAS